MAIGNCVIATFRDNSYDILSFAKACIKVGLPKGVLSIIHGTGETIGDKIVRHPDIKAVSFTGGTKTGKIINTAASGHLKKVSLELGVKIQPQFLKIVIMIKC